MTVHHRPKCSLCGKNKGWVSIHSCRWICHRCEPLNPKTVAKEAGLFWGNCSYNIVAKAFSEQLKEELRENKKFKSLPAADQRLNWTKWISDKKKPYYSSVGRHLLCLLGIMNDKNPRLSEKDFLREKKILLGDSERVEKILNSWGSSLEEIIFFDCLTPRMFNKIYTDFNCDAMEFQLKGMDAKLWNQKLDSAIKKLKKITDLLKLPTGIEDVGFDGPQKVMVNAIQDLKEFYLAVPVSLRGNRNSKSKGENSSQFWKNPIDWNAVSFWAIEILRIRGVPIEQGLDSEQIHSSTKLLEFMLPKLFPGENWNSPQPSSLRKQYDRQKKSLSS